MAEAFHREGDRLQARLSPNERAIVVDLLEQTRQVLTPQDAPQRTGDVFTDLMAELGREPDPQELADRDPVLKRLLPDGHREDAEASREFRSATESALRERKIRNLSTGIEVLTGGRRRVDLDERQAVALMMALGDVRLALAERLGVRTDEDAESLSEQVAAVDAPPSDEWTIAAMYYDFLTWLQESLAVALSS